MPRWAPVSRTLPKKFGCLSTFLVNVNVHVQRTLYTYPQVLGFLLVGGPEMGGLGAETLGTETEYPK